MLALHVSVFARKSKKKKKVKSLMSRLPESRGVALYGAVEVSVMWLHAVGASLSVCVYYKFLSVLRSESVIVCICHCSLGYKYLPDMLEK